MTLSLPQPVSRGWEAQGGLDNAQVDDDGERNGRVWVRGRALALALPKPLTGCLLYSVTYGLV